MLRLSYSILSVIMITVNAVVGTSSAFGFYFQYLFLSSFPDCAFLELCFPSTIQYARDTGNYRWIIYPIYSPIILKHLIHFFQKDCVLLTPSRIAQKRSDLSPMYLEESTGRFLVCDTHLSWPYLSFRISQPSSYGYE